MATDQLLARWVTANNRLGRARSGEKVAAGVEQPNGARQPIRDKHHARAANNGAVRPEYLGDYGNDAARGAMHTPVSMPACLAQWVRFES